MKHLYCLAALLLMFLAFSAYANDPLPRARPDSVGLSPDRLERIGQVLRAGIERGRLPGAVVAIARKGRLVYYESFGYLDEAAGTNFWVDPKEQLVVVFMAQTPGPIRWHYRRVINALVLQSIVD